MTVLGDLPEGTIVENLDWIRYIYPPISIYTKDLEETTRIIIKGGKLTVLSHYGQNSGKVGYYLTGLGATKAAHRVVERHDSSVSILAIDIVGSNLPIENRMGGFFGRSSNSPIRIIEVIQIL